MNTPARKKKLGPAALKKLADTLVVAALEMQDAAYESGNATLVDRAEVAYDAASAVEEVLMGDDE